MMEGMTLADWIIVAILAISVLAGFARGFFRSAFSLIGLVVGLSLAAWNYWRFAPILKPMVRSLELADAIAFIIIAVLVMVVAAIVGSLLAKLFEKVGLGCLDRLGGGVFGFVQGLFFVLVGILVTVAFFPQTVWLTEARLPRYFFGALHVSIRVTPSQLSERVRTELQRLEAESKKLIHEGKSK